MPRRYRVRQANASLGAIVLLTATASGIATFGTLGNAFELNIVADSTASQVGATQLRTSELTSQSSAGLWSNGLRLVREGAQAAAKASDGIPWKMSRARRSLRASLKEIDSQIADLRSVHNDVLAYESALYSQRSSVNFQIETAHEQLAHLDVLPSEPITPPGSLESFPLTRYEKEYALREFRNTLWDDLPDHDALATAFGDGARRDYFVGLFRTFQKEVGESLWRVRDELRIDTGVRALLEAQDSSAFDEVRRLLTNGRFIDEQGQPSRFAKMLLASEALYSPEGIASDVAARTFRYGSQELAEIAEIRRAIDNLEATGAVIDEVLASGTLRAFRDRLADAEADLVRAREAILDASKQKSLQVNATQPFFRFARDVEKKLANIGSN